MGVFYTDDIQKLQSALDALLLGKRPDNPVLAFDTPEFKPLEAKMNKLIADIGETMEFCGELSRGNLDGDIPSRHNYLAQSLKQLHSQIASLEYSMRQLKNGKVVGKLKIPGELFESFNMLVDSIAQSSFISSNDSSGNVNSWRYHQILVMMNHLHIILIEADPTGKIVFSNTPAKELLGDIDTLILGGGESSHGELLRDLAAHNIATLDFPCLREVYDRTTGTWYKITTEITSMPYGGNLFIHMVDDVSDWKTKESQLVISATQDSLTSAKNRKSGLDSIDKLLQSGVDPASEHCIAFVDIDGLKMINDTYGHREGDFAIKSIAEVIMSSVRGSDVVLRYGGDEFIILFRDCRAEVAERVIHRMAERLKIINMQDSKPYLLAFSYGVTPFRADGNIKLNELVAEADAKMYAQKKAKKE